MFCLGMLEESIPHGNGTRLETRLLILYVILFAFKKPKRKLLMLPFSGKFAMLPLLVMSFYPRWVFLEGS
jgi:hypothetical protein